MSTGYGDFVSGDGKPVYADASQIGERISLCGKDDLDVYFAMNEEQARKLISALRSAFQHNGWDWDG
jgi:hypothetical protein